MSWNLSFNVLAMSAALLWDLRYVYRSSKYSRCMIFSIADWDRVYPSVLRICHAIGFKQIVNSLTQNESPCKIPCLSWIGPMYSLGTAVLTSRVIFQCFIVLLINYAILVGILCICRQKFNQLWFIESNALFTSIHVHDRFFLPNWASSSTALSINKLSMHPIDPDAHPRWSICM